MERLMESDNQTPERMKRTLRDNDMPDSREMWKIVEQAADRAPAWWKELKQRQGDPGPYEPRQTPKAPTPKLVTRDGPYDTGRIGKPTPKQETQG